MRVPIAVNLESRDGGTAKDAKTVNAIAEVKGEDIRLRKRPGCADLGSVRAGTAQLLYNWNGINAILGDHFMRGTITTIISGPVDTNLSPANAGLQFSAAATNNDAATPRLFYKSRTQAKVVNRAGTHSNVTYASSMGAGTYTILTLTRVGATATASLAEDVFNVGDTVTVAGASDAAYNGAKTVTAITAGVAQQDIPITITRSGTTATATTVSGIAHGLTTATAYTISGANQGEYNGSKTITTAGGSTFTYTVTLTSFSALTGTWNPADKDSGVTLSGGNLTASIVHSSSSGSAVRGTAGKSSGKWYFEVTITATSGLTSIGVANSSMPLTNSVGEELNSWGYYSSGRVAHGAAIASGGAYSSGDVIGVALNMDAGSVTFYKNGVSQGGFSGLTGTIYAAISASNLGSTTATANFAGTPFIYDPTQPVSPATGSISVLKPAVNPTFSYTVAGTPATPDAGASKTAAGNGGTVPGITYINGYFSVMDVNGVIWTSASDDPTTWDALDFVTAQFENGAGRALVQSANLNVALKEWSTEFFYDRQDSQVGSPFSPVDNGFTRVGCASGTSAAYVGPGVAWIAQTKQEGRSAYFMVGTEQQRISTPDIDRILNGDDLATVYAYGLELDGHPLYVLTLVTSGITLVYDLTTKLWGQWTSYTAGSPVSVTSITRDGMIATVACNILSTLQVGDVLTIAGSSQPEYNGTFPAITLPTVAIGSSFTIPIRGTPISPATGTMTVTPYTESYFKFTKAAQYNGTTLLLHESDGHLYQMDADLKRDATLPINYSARTTRMDGGSTGLKRMASAEVIADAVTDFAIIRWSDDDCTTFSAYRLIDLSADQPSTYKCGAFRRRTIEFRHVGNTGPTVSGLELEIG